MFQLDDEPNLEIVMHVWKRYVFFVSIQVHIMTYINKYISKIMEQKHHELTKERKRVTELISNSFPEMFEAKFCSTSCPLTLRDTPPNQKNKNTTFWKQRPLGCPRNLVNG